jgi:TatD DNase family protein
VFSDTHCHLHHVSERGEDLRSLIASLSAERYSFIFDIGTKPGDFNARVETVARASEGMQSLAEGVPEFIHFSVGLWPDGEVIAERADALKALEGDVKLMLDLARRRAGLGAAAYAALGECGLDRYWNGPAAAARIAESAVSVASASDDGPGTTDIAGEEELFGLQLEIARRYGLPAIIHSRDAFDATLGCIKNSGFDRGVIHCFSYGMNEARAFLDRGWYLSFPGNITWPKKIDDRDRVRSLIRYVPRDRLLLETDSPYLTPAPHRGKTNTPYLVRHVYARAAECLDINEGALAEIVFANARELFSRAT